MTYVFTQPQVMAAVAADVTGIGSAIAEANAAAVSSTTGVTAAAADEVSTAIAHLFSTYAQQHQALFQQAAAFHDRFAQMLAAASNFYVETEAANATAVSRALEALTPATQALLGQPLVGTGMTASSSTLARIVNSSPLAAAAPAITFVLGGSGDPLPSTNFINAVNKLFIQITPGLTGTTATGLTTPENFFPFTGFNSMPLVKSVSDGVQILDQALQPYVANNTPVGVFGYSQSAIIASLEMQKLAITNPNAPIQFELIGDLMNPNGGIFERFAGLQLPSLGIDFYGATPADAFKTTIYTLEYDGYADFPRYPLNILSDINALFGSVHLDYPNLTSSQIASAIQLPTTGATTTTYYMIPTDHLPLLDPLRSVSFIGNPLADLLQPDMTYLVNLGYGDPLYGWSTSPANVPTPFGLLPPLNAFQELPGLLVSGAQQGVSNFVSDIRSDIGFDASAPLSSLLPSVTAATSATPGVLTNPSAGLSAVTAAPANVVNTLASAGSTAYGAAVATGDILYAGTLSVPAYDMSLFLGNLGDPINALGLPLAANTGLYTMLGIWEYSILNTAITGIAGDFAGLIP